MGEYADDAIERDWNIEFDKRHPKDESEEIDFTDDLPDDESLGYLYGIKFGS